MLLYEEPTKSGDDYSYENGVRRNTILPSMFGDVLSPGRPSNSRNGGEVKYHVEDGSILAGTLQGILRDNTIHGEFFTSSLAKIPVQPISQDAAKYIMENLEDATTSNKRVPTSWKPGKLVTSYKVRSNLYKSISRNS